MSQTNQEYRIKAISNCPLDGKTLELSFRTFQTSSKSPIKLKCLEIELVLLALSPYNLNMESKFWFAAKASGKHVPSSSRA